jgi:Lon protease-like protein
MHSIVVLLSILILIDIVLSYQLKSSLSLLKRRQSYSQLYSSEDDLWMDRVQYVDLNVQVEPSPTARPLPLFLLGVAFYPQGVTFLNVFEMKYRTMMFDCSNSDDMFGYIHTNPQTGEIASIGTMCKITDRELLDDGRQYIALEGVSRFRVRKILKTLPYVLAEVEPYIQDDAPKDNQEEISASKLEREVYDCLKYYMRLMKLYAPNKNMTVSQATKKSRPGQFGFIPGSKEDLIRRTDFSFALANMIQMTQATESQIILQTVDVTKRLRAEKVILKQASELIAEQLLKMDILTADKRDGIKMKSINDDYDDDILPQDVIESKEEKEVDEWDISQLQ